MVRLYEYKTRTNTKQQLSIHLRSSFTDSELHLNSWKLSNSAVKRFGHAYKSEIMTLQIKDHSNNSNSKKKNYFQAALVGQEFVFDSSEETEKWIFNVLIK